MNCLIYKIINQVNDKVYIGQTWSTLQRRARKDYSGYKSCKYFYRAIKKYGLKNFKSEIIVSCDNQLTADYLEKFWITTYDSRNNEKGYNIREAGNNGKHSIESREKNRLAQLGKKASEETKKKMSLSHQNMSNETRQKMSLVHKGNKHNIGRKASEITKFKMQEAHKNKTWKLINDIRVYGVKND